MGAPIRYGVAMFATYTVGFIGSLFLRTGWNTWYELIAKPPFSLSSSILITLWVVIYTLLGLALGVFWNQTDLWHPWIGNFFVGLIFHSAWVMFFFGFHVILLALLILTLLLLISTSLLIGAMEVDARAGYLFMPYMLWLLFAFYLNAGVWYLG